MTTPLSFLCLSPSNHEICIYFFLVFYLQVTVGFHFIWRKAGFETCLRPIKHHCKHHTGSCFTCTFSLLCNSRIGKSHFQRRYSQKVCSYLPEASFIQVCHIFTIMVYVWKEAVRSSRLSMIKHKKKSCSCPLQQVSLLVVVFLRYEIKNHPRITL